MLNIYTDGSSDHNTRHGGWAVFIPHRNVKLSGNSYNTTNNRMEMFAVLTAMRFLNTHNEDGVIYCDSQYVVRGINEWMYKWKNQGWCHGKKSILNADLWHMIFDLKSKLTINVQLKWVRGHAGNTYNEMVDQMAVNARKKLSKK